MAAVSAGNLKLTFEGFADWIGQHGHCEQQFLTQPRLHWDAGQHFGHTNRWFLGLELQYWRNKFGIRDENEQATQLFMMWKL